MFVISTQTNFNLQSWYVHVIICEVISLPRFILRNKELSSAMWSLCNTEEELHKSLPMLVPSLSTSSFYNFK